MRILHIIPNLSGGGAERQLSYLAPELARMGHEMHIAYSNVGPQEPELPRVLLHQFKLLSNYDPYLFWQILELIHTIKPDIIHTWILQMDILGGVAALLTKTPWILREPNQASAYKKTLKNIVRKKIGAHADAIVANSLGGKEYWEDCASSDRIHHIGNCLPLEYFSSFLSDSMDDFIKPSPPIVLFVGRLNEGHKRPKAFLEAIAHIKDQIEIAGVVCGDGPQYQSLIHLTRELGISNNVQFMGHLPANSVWDIMKRAAVFVSLSAYEGCPNTVMEAMACGCPLVLSDIPAHREICSDSCAVFTDPSHIERTAECIINVLENKQESLHRAIIAKQLSNKFTIDEMVNKYITLYKSILR